MASERVQRFLDALKALEEAHDVGPMSSVYTSDCVVGNVVSPHRFHGVDGAKQFWSDYRRNFTEVRSTFRNIIESGDRAALEWVTTGRGPDGQSLEYEGTSILEFRGDQICRFHAFFDSSRLGRQMEQRGMGRSVGAERDVPAIH